MKSNVQPAAHLGQPVPRRFNALKHGRRSASVLLPGDDVADFRRLRHDLFHLHKPRTIEEALCVETIASCHWRILRARAEQTAFKDHLGLALGGDPQGGVLGNADPHVLHHRAQDCGIEEQRLSRIKHREYTALAQFQKQRALHLNPGGPEALQDYRTFMAAAEPALEEETPEEDIPQEGTGSVAGETQSVGRVGAGGLPEAPSNMAPGSNAQANESQPGVGGAAGTQPTPTPSSPKQSGKNFKQTHRPTGNARAEPWPHPPQETARTQEGIV